MRGFRDLPPPLLFSPFFWPRECFEKGSLGGGGDEEQRNVRWDGEENASLPPTLKEAWSLTRTGAALLPSPREPGSHLCLLG